MLTPGLNPVSVAGLRSIEQLSLAQAGNVKKLSTGSRVNSAADDAASLAISQKLLTQVNGLGQAIKNVQDGISLLQTAEGGLEQITNLLQRARTLSVQAANGTLTVEDRSLIQEEVDQILAEIARIASTVQFNNKFLLNGQGTGNQRVITSQSDFLQGSSSQSGGVDEIDFTSSPGSIQLATEPWEVDVPHADPGNEDYVDIFRTSVTSLGNGQYNVDLSVRFRADGGANNYTGSFILNDANITAVNGFNLGAGDFANQNGNQVDFGINLTDAEGLAGFDITFTTTDPGASFDLDLNTPVDQSINTYFDDTLIQSGVPPYDAIRRFEPVFTSGTYTTEAIDLGAQRNISVDVVENKPTGSTINYEIQTSATGLAGSWSASQPFTPGVSFTVDQRFVRVLANLSTPASLAANGITPSIDSITVTPRGNSIIIQDGANKDQNVKFDLPDARLSELGLLDINLLALQGDVIFSQTITSQQDFESGTLNSLTANLNPGRLELATEPFGTEVPGGSLGQERYISVSRSVSTANPDGTVTSTVRVVTGSDSTVPRDNPGGVVAQTAQTRFTGRFRLLDGSGSPLFNAFDENTVAPVSLEGYDPGGDAIPPYFHGTTSPGPGNANDDIVNGPGNPPVGGDGNLIEEDGFVEFDISTVGVQDGFDITFTAKPDVQFEIFNLVAKDKFDGGPGNIDVPVDIYFGPQLLGMLDSGGGPQSISQPFEERQLSGTFESAVLDLGAGGLNRVNFTATTPGATSVLVEYQTSSDGISFTPYQAIANGGTFTSNADQRFVRLRVTMTGDPANRYITPTIDDLTVARITAADGAELAIESFSNALETVTEKRATIGAQQNRLEGNMEYLKESHLNQSRSRSLLIDADMAEVITDYTKRNIIQRTAMSFLTQALLINRSIIGTLLQTG